MKKHTTSNVFFFLFLFIILTAALYKAILDPPEAFSNFNYALGKYPNPQGGRILPSSDFPYTENKGVSSCSAGMIWRNYPEFEVGSYAQETNNIRHPPNPDEGTCMPADMCGALYKNRKAQSNVVTPMLPVNENVPGVRVNYYMSDTPNGMPFYNKGNIEY